MHMKYTFFIASSERSKITLIKSQKQPFADVFENMFFKILQYSQENACAGVNFSEVAGLDFTKRDSNTGVLL